MVFAKSMDRNSIDVFHHQERLSFGGHATVQKPRNQRMIEPGENLTLKSESLSEKVSGQRQIDQLDGDLLLETTVCAMSRVHGAHTSAPNEPIDFIRADTLSVVIGNGVKVRLFKAGLGKQLFRRACA